MKSEWKQDFNQDLLVRWTEPTENKKSGNKKQEDDQWGWAAKAAGNRRFKDNALIFKDPGLERLSQRLLSAQSRIRRTRRLIVCQRLEGKKVGETNSFSLDTKRSTKKASLTATWVLLQTLNIQLLMSTLP